MNTFILAAASSFTMTSPNLCDSQTQYSFEISSTKSSIKPACVDNTRVINTQNSGRISYFSSQQSNSNWGTLYVFDAENSGQQVFSIATQEIGPAQYTVRDGQNPNSILAQIDTSDIGADSLVIRNNRSSIVATANKQLLTTSNPDCANTQWSINNQGNLPAPVIWYLVAIVSNSNFQCPTSVPTQTKDTSCSVPTIIGSSLAYCFGALTVLGAFKLFPTLTKGYRRMVDVDQ